MVLFGQVAALAQEEIGEEADDIDHVFLVRALLLKERMPRLDFGMSLLKRRAIERSIDLSRQCSDLCAVSLTKGAVRRILIFDGPHSHSELVEEVDEPVSFGFADDGFFEGVVFDFEEPDFVFGVPKSNAPIGVIDGCFQR